MCVAASVVLPTCRIERNFGTVAIAAACLHASKLGKRLSCHRRRESQCVFAVLCATIIGTY